MFSADAMREALEARDGETVYEAALRMRAERDALVRREVIASSPMTTAANARPARIGRTPDGLVIFHR